VSRVVSVAVVLCCCTLLGYAVGHLHGFGDGFSAFECVDTADPNQFVAWTPR
jgi:hypothetical protein